LENNTTALLVRSVAAGWKKGSVLAVDAGVHLAAIAKILKKNKTEYFDETIQLPVSLFGGPFEGLEIQHRSPKANAAYITRHIIDTCLLTHAHLDHINGFVINTASLPGSRPKRLAGLPRTIEAVKTHIFNNIIWPNLSDENNGAGLITYMRLVEGGSPALGDGDGKGYVEICEGLGVKAWSVSHGHCIEKHSHRGSNAGLTPLREIHESVTRLHTRANSTGQVPSRRERRDTVSTISSQGTSHDLLRTNSNEETFCVYDSSAFFIRDFSTGTEILVFGDVEPDSISLSPRNKYIWSEAAPKIVSGALRGIFIECSYDDSQSTDFLFGHLAPRFLIEELTALAREVEDVSRGQSNDRVSIKRKRSSHPIPDDYRQKSPRKSYSLDFDAMSPGASYPFKQSGEHRVQPTRDEGNPEGNSNENEGVIPMRDKDDLPLKGLKIVIIHMKDKLRDGPLIEDTILEQLLEYEMKVQLGCEFVISHVGMSLYL
jgi:cAMP phosphodiesterase